jgi:hypothetical protein
MNMHSLSLNYEFFMINVSSQWKNFIEVKIEFYDREIKVFEWENVRGLKIWIIVYPKFLQK